ncbi:hypothetical protein T4B_4418 [Trichinella pseudospiralis]|uniref:FLYWCH-type domain-containing protein n=1 Tax=Trichinella pseudospiralis TaxID=6337 RepID=A0A0V1EHI5_TRIPS|nr:hypothetical protein T4A_11362 [Trichinella pseudospiralis]KRZ27767.1 hypothetical protein T4B_7882 [Trichinella pseudospiralis]KRZ27826.1 hypothetical protein T4B_4418 [Trichinella pseudospiralis]KRZ39195.1 hypothetical protein T4C_8829 [Trichinella pseudospiralis]
MADISEVRFVANCDGSMSLVHESKLKHKGKQKKYWGCSKKQRPWSIEAELSLLHSCFQACVSHNAP